MLLSQRHFPKGDFLSDNFPSGNFPNVQFSKRGSFPKVRLGLQRRCKLPGRNINLWQIPEHYRSSQLDKDADWFIQKSYSANHQNCCFCICWQLLQKWLINLVLRQFSLNLKKKILIKKHNCSPQSLTFYSLYLCYLLVFTFDIFNTGYFIYRAGTIKWWNKNDVCQTQFLIQ